MTPVMSNQSVAVAGQTPEQIQVQGRQAEVYMLGKGPPLLLLHGGWAGACVHWRSVWGILSETHRVIAPELPGVVTGSPLESYDDYSSWVAELLRVLGLERVNCVGNSLGGILGWYLAAQFPNSVHRLVLVDGGVVPRDPVSRALLPLPGGVRILQWLARYNNFSPSTLTRAFADPQRAPDEIVERLRHPRPHQFELMFRLFLRGTGDIDIPRVPVHILWGRQDRLIGWTARTGRQIARRIPGATLDIIEDAGHLPQVEQPAQFVRVLRTVIGAQ